MVAWAGRHMGLGGGRVVAAGADEGGVEGRAFGGGRSAGWGGSVSAVSLGESYTCY